MKPLSDFKKIRQKFWIRKDRENYLLSGVLLAAITSGFISSYWHYADRMEVFSKIDIDLHMNMEEGKEFDRFKEAASYSTTPQEGEKQYFKLEENPEMAMPELYTEEPAQESDLTTVQPLDNDSEQE